jgi:hypothetical protein
LRQDADCIEKCKLPKPGHPNGISVHPILKGTRERGLNRRQMSAMPFQSVESSCQGLECILAKNPCPGSGDGEDALPFEIV